VGCNNGTWIVSLIDSRRRRRAFNLGTSATTDGYFVQIFALVDESTLGKINLRVAAIS